MSEHFYQIGYGLKISKIEFTGIHWIVEAELFGAPLNLEISNGYKPELLKLLLQILLGPVVGLHSRAYDLIEYMNNGINEQPPDRRIRLGDEQPLTQVQGEVAGQHTYPAGGEDISVGILAGLSRSVEAAGNLTPEMIARISAALDRPPFPEVR